ncbi:MAG: hypothetical protein H8K03_19205 [Nitrospira sp.]
MHTPPLPPNVIWICRACWRQRSDDDATLPPIPSFIGLCAECDAKDLPLVYVQVVPTSIHTYKGRSIRLTLGEQDRHWGCHFLVIELGNTQAASPKGFVVGGNYSYADAEAKALQAAQRLIDSKELAVPSPTRSTQPS